MNDTSIYLSDEAPEYLRDLISHKAQEIDDGDIGHNYLKPGAPRWMADKIRAMEKDAGQIHQNTVEEYRQKDATWLMKIDGYVDGCGIPSDYESGPSYLSSAGYQLVNVDWDARLYVATNTTREQAITLAAGFLKWLMEMRDEDFNRRKMPKNSPRLSPPNRGRVTAG